ncbi:hypothetical protein chiPu_0020518, partial [Chiloscyllium punctatum]|nr:hypothetical protein [Chiloscyllium punctatum]
LNCQYLPQLLGHLQAFNPTRNRSRHRKGFNGRNRIGLVYLCMCACESEGLSGTSPARLSGVIWLLCGWSRYKSIMWRLWVTLIASDK